MSSSLTRPPLAAIEAACSRWNLAGQTLVIGVSGGADSTALLRLFIDVRDRLDLRIVVAHFDHRLRDASVRDSEWVQSLASSWGLASQLGAPDLTPPVMGAEAWARKERYAFLERVAAAHDAAWVAVAHTAEDQAETVLHHVIRGTGLQGLKGMPSVRRLNASVRLLRPLLAVSKHSLRAYLTEIGQSCRHDVSNDDPRWTRNALRLELIPWIESRFNPRLSTSLLSLARQAADAARILRRKAMRTLRHALLEATPREVRLNSAPFANADSAIVREAAACLWRRQDWPRQRMGYRHWARAAQLFQGLGPDRVQWPGGLEGTRRGTLIALCRHLPEA